MSASNFIVVYYGLAMNAYIIIRKGDFLMKMNYEQPKVEIVAFETEDVIVTSGWDVGEEGTEAL